MTTPDRTIPTLWLCNDHYRRTCEASGYEVPILPAFNVLYQKCDESGCEATADVLISDVETMQVREESEKQ